MSPPPAPKPAAAGTKAGSPAGSKRAPAGRSGADKVTKRRRTGWKPTAGARLIEQLDIKRGPPGIEHLITQAGRVADRLEALDRLHSGDAEAWLRLEVTRVLAPELPAGVRKAFYADIALRIEPTIAEEARQAKLLASLLGDIQRQRANMPPSPPSSQNGQRPRVSDLDVDNDDY